MEKSHGRNEHREYTVAGINEKDRAACSRWPELKTIGMVFRKRQQNDKEQMKVSFFISSCEPKVRTLAEHIRGHQSIENSQHCVVDVTFAEDASRIRRGNSPEISGSIRRMALNILQGDRTIKDNIRGKRLRAGSDDNALERIWAASSRF